MGLKVFQIVGGREALEVECDDPAHGDEIRRAWFDCGPHSDNLTLAIAAGWGERRNSGTSVWLCPSCVRGHADHTHLEGRYVTQGHWHSGGVLVVYMVNTELMITGGGPESAPEHRRCRAGLSNRVAIARLDKRDA
jgi:hypothetical protein